jgi:hypothetical protein
VEVAQINMVKTKALGRKIIPFPIRKREKSEAQKS